MSRHSQWLFEVPPNLEDTEISFELDYRELETSFKPKAIRRSTRQLSQPLRRNQSTVVRSLQPTQQMPNLPSVLQGLTYADVRSDRIDVFAQKALLRMSKNPAMRADAVGMANAVKSGRLGGIYKEDQKVPALRARHPKINSSWWKLIPKNENAILFLDPNNLKSGIPIIVFRDRIRSNATKLDPAIQKAWRAYSLWRRGEIVPNGNVILSRGNSEFGKINGSTSCEQVVGNVIPQSSCTRIPFLSECSAPSSLSNCRSTTCPEGSYGEHVTFLREKDVEDRDVH